MHPTSTEPQIDPKFLLEFGEQFKDAWNQHDADAVASLCTEDVFWNDAGLPQPARGRSEVARFVTETVRAIPDFHVEALQDSPHAISSALPRVFVPYRMSGTVLGDWKPLGFAPTNRHFSVEGIDQWTFRGELICHYTTYYDVLELARQLGAMPRWGGVGHRVMAKAQRMQAAFLRRSAPHL